MLLWCKWLKVAGILLYEVRQYVPSFYVECFSDQIRSYYIILIQPGAPPIQKPACVELVFIPRRPRVYYLDGQAMAKPMH